MATLAVFDVKGDPSDVLRRYDTLMQRLPGEMPAKPLVHVCVPIETGLASTTCGRRRPQSRTSPRTPVSRSSSATPVSRRRTSKRGPCTG